MQALFFLQPVLTIPTLFSFIRGLIAFDMAQNTSTLKYILCACNPVVEKIC